MKQIDFVNRIVELKAANPVAEIKMCVSNDLTDDYGWTAHKITRVELSQYIEIDGRIYTDEDWAKDGIGEALYDGKMGGSELEKAIEKYYKENVVMAICVYTTIVTIDKKRGE